MTKYQTYATKATLAGLLLFTSLQLPIQGHLQEVQAETKQEEQVEVLHEGEYSYSIKEDGTALLVAYTGEKTLENYQVPTTIGGYPVSEIGTGMYQDMDVQTFEIAGYIQKIQKEAFKNSRMGKMILKEANDTKGEERVYENTTIGEIEFKDTTKIGNNLFSGATIERFSLPESIEEIGAWAFFGANLTGDIKLDFTKPYGEGVFFMSTINGHITLQNITDEEKEYENWGDNPYFQLFNRSEINGNVTVQSSDYIGYQLFSESEINGEVHIAGKHTVIGNHLFRNAKIQKVSMRGTVANITDNAFLNTVIQEPLVIEGDVERIGFRHIPSTYADDDTGSPFIHTEIKGLIIKGKVGEINASSFIGGSLGHLRIEKGLDASYTASFINVKLKKVEILGDIGTLSSHALLNSDNDYDKENGEDYLYTVDIQGDIQNLGTEMKELGIDLGLGVTNYIGTIVFLGATKINIQGNIGMIGDSALGGYGLDTAKQEVIINGNVGKIGEYAFQKGSRADGVDTVEINGDIGYAGDRAFTVTNQKIRVNGRIAKTGKESMNVAYDIEVRDGIGEIGEEAFEYYGRNSEGEFVNKVPKSIFKNVTKIGDRAFIYSKVEDDIVFPETLKEIGDNAFTDTGLTKVKLPKGLQQLGLEAFSKNNLACITIPKGVTKTAEDMIMQENGQPIEVYGTEAKGHKLAYSANEGVTFIENSIFTNECDKETWGVQVNAKTVEGKLLQSDYITEPKEGQLTIESPNIEGYLVKGSKVRELAITDDTPNHVVDFVYEPIKPEPPTEPSEPPVEKPEPPTEPSEPPVENPDPPTEPSEPNEKPDPPTEPSEPTEKPEPPIEPSEPNEKPDPPTEPSEPNEKPDPPTEPSEPTEKPDPPTEPSEPITGSEQTIIQKPLEQEETHNKGSELVDTEKEETLPKTGTEKEPVGLWGLLIGMLGYVLVRKK